MSVMPRRVPDTRAPAWSPAAAALFLGLALAVGLRAATWAAYYGLEIPVVAGLHHLFGDLTKLLAVGVPCLLWPCLRRDRSPRMRALIAAALLLAAWGISFELAPRLSMAVLRHDLPDWGVIPISVMRPDTWTTLGFIEYAPLAAPGSIQAELRQRAHDVVVLLAAMLPLLRERVGASASRLALLATVAMLLLPFVLTGWASWLARPTAALACAVALLLRSPSELPPSPRRAPHWASAAVAASLLGLGFLVVLKACQIDLFCSDLHARLGW